MKSETREIAASALLEEVTVESLRAALFSETGGDTKSWLSSRDPARGPGKDLLYIRGFRCAADELVLHLREGTVPTHLRDAFLYPIFFNYRHYLELRLKRATWLLRAFLGKPEVDLKKHDLLRLWRNFRELHEQAVPPVGLQDRDDHFRKLRDRIDMYMQVIHAMDPGSMSFRYTDAPFSATDGLGEYLAIDYENVKNHIAVLSALLDETGWP